MNTNQFTFLYYKAIKFSNRKFQDPFLKEDFPSFVIINALKRGYNKVQLDSLYIDYLRENLGRNDVKESRKFNGVKVELEEAKNVVFEKKVLFEDMITILSKPEQDILTDYLVF